MQSGSLDLAALFQTISAALVQNRGELNAADPYNGNHGDHMVEIFRIASLAALEKNDAGLPEAMEYAATLLGQYEQNGSAGVYARGLRQLAAQFRQRNLRLEDLLPYVQQAVEGGESAAQNAAPQAGQTAGEGTGKAARSAEVLRALLSALAGWERSEAQAAEGAGPEAGQEPAGGLDLGTLLGMGMSYMQAKGKSGDRQETLAETVVASSPLGKVPHRAQSGKLVFTTLLRALTGTPG
jgi:hypothetical protein